MNDNSDALAFKRASRLAQGAKLSTVNSLYDEYRLGGGRAPVSIRIGKVVAEGPLYSGEEGHYIVVSDSKEINRYFGSRVDLSSWMKYAESEEHLPTLAALSTRIERVGEARAVLHHPEARCWLGPCRLEYSGESEELRVFVPENPEPVDVRDVPPTRFREAALKKYSAELSGWIEGPLQEQLPSSFLVGTHGAPMPPRSVALREPPSSVFLVSRATGDERRWYVREYAGTISLEGIAALLKEHGAHRVDLGVDFLTFFARPSLAYTLKHALEASPGIQSIDIQMVTRQEQDEPDDEKPEVGTKDTQVDPSVSDVPEDEGDEEEVSLIGFEIRFLTNDGEIAEGTVTDEEGDVLTVRTADGEVQEINVDQLLGEGVDLSEEEPEPEPPEEGEEEEEEDEEEPDEELEKLLTDAELLLIEIEEAVTGGYSSRHSHDVAGSSLARKAGKDAMKAASPPTGPGSREKCPEGQKKDSVTGLCVPTQEDLTTGMIASYEKPLGSVIRAPFPQKKKKRDDDED